MYVVFAILHCLNYIIYCKRIPTKAYLSTYHVAEFNQSIKKKFLNVLSNTIFSNMGTKIPAKMVQQT